MTRSLPKALLLLFPILALLSGCPQESVCARAIQCVERCGGPVVAMSCECPGGSFDRDRCAPDAGRDAGQDAGPALPEIEVVEESREACAERNPERNAYFGDLHVHTALSFDAAAYDVRTRPVDAYAFARGEEIGLPPYDAGGAPTRTIRLLRPLDFAAVTDHAEFLAETEICNDPSSPGYDSRTCVSYREGDRSLADYGELTGRFVSRPFTRVRLCREQPELCATELRTAWGEIREAAEEAYDRSSGCAFTSFVGYEWTGSALGTNLHRNVLFRSASVPAWPLSFFEAQSPEALWEGLTAGCIETGTPCDVLSIPHNANLSAGTMFVPEREDGSPYTREDAERRAALEPLVEIYQHKGASECVSGVDDPLASEDELCSFEQLHPSFCTGSPDDPERCATICDGGEVGFLGGCIAPADLARGALRRGLSEWARTGANPFETGFIASTDTHSAQAGGVEEPTFRGHLGDSEDEPEEILSLPPIALIRGRTTSPGGLAAVWAEENTREAIFDAMRRRETYATSGPRILLRFFGGAYPAELCDATDRIEQGYASGVPMGGHLAAPPAGEAPRFLVAATRDPMGAPLQRLQLVKLWLEGGESREQVFEVAGDPDNGASVDEASCTPTGAGADSLCAVFTDPAFDPSQPAIYYVRAVENPTCRWSRYVCNEAGVDCGSVGPDDPFAACCDPSVTHTVQERAWSSPIWYYPESP